MPTALITGASAGIGAAFAEALAARQHHLVLIARSEAKLQQLADQLHGQYNVPVNIIAQDLTQATAAATVFDTAQQQGWTIDLLVNNAGLGDYGEFAASDHDLQIRMVQLNILALVDLTHRFLPQMRQRHAGGIINMASVAAFQPMPYFSLYAATKAFILNFSEAIAAENRKYGVDVVAVCPGPTETNFFQEAGFPAFLAGVAEQNYTPVKVVVQDALRALEQHQPIVVPGSPTNQLLANLPRFLPREAVTHLWKTILGLRSDPAKTSS